MLRSNQKYNILWLEDNIYGIQWHMAALERSGYNLRITADIDEAISFYCDPDSNIDLIITDLMMHPGKNYIDRETQGGRITGAIFAEEIRKIDKNIPIIILSDLRPDAYIDDIVALNAVPLHKYTINPERLVSQVGKLIGREYRRDIISIIVHGHDENAKLALKNYIQNVLKLGEPIILHEQASGGKTLIEKFEQISKNIEIVFVLLTPDDNTINYYQVNNLKHRSRQNVIFEMGYFFGKLQRRSGKILLLYKGDIELPSDILGISYIDITNGIDAAGEEIRRELSDIL